MSGICETGELVTIPFKTLAAVILGTVWLVSSGDNPGQVRSSPASSAVRDATNALSIAGDELRLAQVVYENARVAQTLAIGSFEYHQKLLATGDTSATQKFEIAKARKEAASTRLIDAAARLQVAEENKRKAKEDARQARGGSTPRGVPHGP